jgi:hypothetical protein
MMGAASTGMKDDGEERREGGAVVGLRFEGTTLSEPEVGGKQDGSLRDAKPAYSDRERDGREGRE